MHRSILMVMPVLFCVGGGLVLTSTRQEVSCQVVSDELAGQLYGAGCITKVHYCNQSPEWEKKLSH